MKCGKCLKVKLSVAAWAKTELSCVCTWGVAGTAGAQPLSECGLQDGSKGDTQGERGSGKGEEGLTRAERVC